MASKDIINPVDVNNPSKTRRSSDLLPSYHRTDKNIKFLSSTLDQLIQQPQLERIDGFLGSKLSPNFNPDTDRYIDQANTIRSNYQLNPSLIVKDTADNITQALAYDDLINQLEFYGSKVNNLDRLFETEAYSYDPGIDWDKFINFNQYYWMPTGPDSIEITGLQQATNSTYTVTDSTDGNFLILSPDGVTPNPLLTLYRGLTYVFDVDSKYPFYIKTAYVPGEQNLYSGVVNNGTKKGRVLLTVDDTTPTVLYYFAEGNENAIGQIITKPLAENTVLNVATEILGKKTYRAGSGVEFSNGMKVHFVGDVTPSTYLNKEFIVEGVGTQITLVDYDTLKVQGQATTNLDPNFDATPFDEYPFDDFSFLPLTPEYVTINRSAPDLNSWSRYNRWVHGDVIAATAVANNVTAVYPVENRAQRPIIEFAAGMRLFNFGTLAKNNIDLIDTITASAFRTVEGSAGFYIDGILVEQGFRVMFNADSDPLVRGRIYQVEFVTINDRSVISLVETADGEPTVNNAVVAIRGTKYANSNWWFNGDNWSYGQQKTALNQAPLFDLFDNAGNRYSDQSLYNSNFFGTKIFGYSIGTGTNDPVLGFPLNYRNVVNVGDYLFENYFMTDTFTNFNKGTLELLNVANGYLQISSADSTSYKNVWVKSQPISTPILQFQVLESAAAFIQIAAINDSALVGDLTVDVFVNDKKLILDIDYTIKTASNQLFIVPTTVFNTNDRVLFKLYTTALPNDNGYYEAPLGLTTNPLNGGISEFTLTELSNHVKTIVDNNNTFIGKFPGDGNLRDLGDISSYGQRLVSHSNPISFAHYFLGNSQHNLIEAIRKVSNDYNHFKIRLLAQVAALKNVYSAPKTLDNALAVLNLNKDKTFPYNYSDMLGYGTSHTTRTYTVTNSRNVNYSLDSIFDNTVLSERSVLVYLNSIQLVFGKDYQFESYDPSVTILTPLVKGDVIVVSDYSSTVGSYVPPTPSKLGLYPKFAPSKYLDTTYTTPTWVIQGHDGSVTVAFNDYRDDVLLEFETRIYNNIKSPYNYELFDINTIAPGAFRTNKYSLTEVNSTVEADFLKWVGFFGVDYQTNTVFDQLNPFTFNYSATIDSINGNTLPGYWRAAYKYFYDTDRPHTNPWEMLGFSDEPSWWQSIYGPAPYTSGNLVLWQDLEAGMVVQGDRIGVNTLYIRPGLSTIIPVDESGNLLDPTTIGLAVPSSTDQATPARIGVIRSTQISANWAFGDQGPAETAWRRSSYWPFACQVMLALTNPNTYTSTLFDVSRMKKNIANQYKYGSNEIFLNPTLVELFNDTSNGSRVLASGHSVLLIETGLAIDVNYLTKLKINLANINYNLMAKLGGFVSKDKIQVTIDAVDPSSPYPGLLLPQEDFYIFFNQSNPVKSLSISGLIIQKTETGYSVRGYDQYTPHFTVYQPLTVNSDQAERVGGASAAYTIWAINTKYTAGQIVFYTDRYYTVKTTHNSDATFNAIYYQSLPYLPTVGGVAVSRRSKFSSQETTVPYGTEFTTIQAVYDLIVGYGQWLTTNGFAFSEYNSDLAQVLDWTFTAKEFLYWTTQNWSLNSVITLSPFANKLVFNSTQGVVDSVTNSFYEYSMLRADGSPFPETNLTFVRLDGEFSITTVNTTDGIYFARLNVVQKEHALVFNNFTLFNDIIYDEETGYRQMRIKLTGFRTANWNGDFFSPGFIFDSAKISDWNQFTDYTVGDVVRFSGKYYSALASIPGTSTFTASQWTQLPEQPQPALLGNFDYKINQFQDFYSLDIDNFDAGQQAAAQHLTGYTPRAYLNYIIGNPIAQYKFYQGMIKEKGTRNSVTKLARASLNNLQSNIDFNEEWAFRIGYYGGYNTYQELETGLQSSDFIENPQIISFVETIDTSKTDSTYYKTESDIEIKPDNFDITNVFPTIPTTFEDSNLQLPVAGYVRFDDISATAYNKNSVLDIANNKALIEGNTIWEGFRGDGSWDVLRYTQISTVITAVTLPTPNELLMTTYYPHQLTVGDLISVSRIADGIDQCYTVLEVVTPTQFKVATTLALLPVLPILMLGLLFAFKSSRLSTFDDIVNIPSLERWQDGEKIWVDEDSAGKWAVYRKINNYDSTTYNAGVVNTDQHFGTAIATGESTSTMIVSSPDYIDVVSTASTWLGRVFVLDQINAAEPSIIFSYALNDPNGTYYAGSGATGFGQSLAYNTITSLTIVGAPLTSNIKAYTTNGITTATYSANPLTWQEQGAVKLSLLNYTGYAEQSQVVLTTSATSTGTLFGTSVFLSDNSRLIVGAPGEHTNGAVYVYDIKVGPITTSTIASTLMINTSTMYVSDVSKIYVGYGVSGTNIPSNTTVSSINSNSVILTENISIVSTGTILTFTDTVSPNQIFVNSVVNLSVDFGSNISSQFGSQVTGNIDLTRIAVSAPNYIHNTYQGAVYIFTSTNDTYIQRIDTETDPSLHGRFTLGDQFANTITLSNTGTYLAIGSPQATDNLVKSGVVDIYKMSSTGTYVWNQTLHAPIITNDTRFGQAISFNDAGDVLTISSVGNARSVETTFDVYTDRETGSYVNDPTSIKHKKLTTFDSGSTHFHSKITNAGSVHVYNRYVDKWAYAQELFSTDVAGESLYGESMYVTNNNVVIGAPGQKTITSTEKNNGQIFIFNRLDTTVNSWELYRQQEDSVDISKIDRVVTIDSTTEQIQDYIDVIDPVKGQILGIAKEELTYISSYDPAIYSIGTTGTNVNTTISWLDEQVGQLWWDLSTVKYVWSEQGDLTYRKNNWNTVFPGSSIDIYEWVSSAYLPSQWSSLADTTDGLSQGISGQPKFADNSVICVKQVFNSISNSFSNIYYYWVKNKSTVPANVANRRKAAFEVAQEIADPVGSGLKFMAIISPTSLMLANTKPAIITDTYNLSIAFDSINDSALRHTEWLILTENDPTSQPNVLLEKKLIDSLIGYDSLGNTVPDPTLPSKLKYGVGIRPRQTLFVDRIEALRNVVEYTNSILLQYQISNLVNFDNLNAIDPVPAASTYDISIEDIYNLDLVMTTNLTTAELQPIIDSNGRVQSVKIINSGFGYITPPTITVNGTGSGAELAAVIDAQGKIISVTVVNAGSGYLQDTELSVRPYTVFVQTDASINGKWSVYQWNTSHSTWSRTRTQNFDTTLFWKYVDWADPSYKSSKPIVTSVSEVYALAVLTTVLPGQYVKVANSGNGNYIILSKTNGTGGTFDKDWDLIYSQNGTIQILDSLWNYALDDFAWDEVVGWDQTEYDQSPVLEIAYILTAIKDDIFIGARAIYWNKLFFKAVRYALSEQKSLDWAFKTTFINVTNNSGNLDQRPTYKLQNSVYFQQYLEEVKPYHTKIRQFKELYTSTEYSASFTTDFDSPAYYNTATLNFNKVQFGDTQLLSYPWLSWLENYGLSLGSIEVFDGGSGYEQVPAISIVPVSGDTGSGATAIAYVSLGKISNIIVTNPGSGYTETPLVVIHGGGNTLLTPATVIPRMINTNVRTTALTMKFDRVSGNREIGSQFYTDRFVGNGELVDFSLTYPPVADKTKITITVNGVFVLVDEYNIVYTKNSYSPQQNTSYIKEYATLKLNFIPADRDVIVITYPKSLDLYHAVERAQDYYEPVSGMPGNTGTQIMSGLEYPGITIDTLPLTFASAWDVVPFSSTAWDNYAQEDGYFSTSTNSTGTLTVAIPTIIPAGVEMNVYIQYTDNNGNRQSTRIDGTGSNALIPPLVGIGAAAVDHVNVINPGKGYPNSVVVTISAPNTSTGVNAVATAIIDSNTGTVSLINMALAGAGYTSTPVVSISGGYTIPAYFSAVLRSQFTQNGTTSSTVIIPADAFVSTSSLVVFRYSTSDATVLPTDRDSLDAVITGGNLSTTTNGFITAAGISPSEIIVDGDGFLSTFNSYAPEECVPGQIQESLGINVYTQPPTNAPLIVNKKYNTNGLTSTFALGIKPSNSDSVTALFNDTVIAPTNYTIDFIADTITFTMPLGVGLLSLTSMRPGSLRLLDTIVVNDSGTTSTIVNSAVKFKDVGSVYVTVNGIATSDYVLSSARGRARLTIQHGTQPISIQAFFFNGVNKSFSEVNEQIIIASTATNTFDLTYPPGNLGPFHSQVIVTKNGARLDPPVTTYYEAADSQVTFDISNSITFALGKPDIGRIEAYVNGVQKFAGADWLLDQPNNQVIFVQGKVVAGDAVAIVVKLGHQYLIQNNQLVLTVPAGLYDEYHVTSYTNHDPDFIRTERYNGHSNNDYIMQRAVFNSAYVWVTYNGLSLTVDRDYKVNNDGRTVTIEDGFYQANTDSIVITSFADITAKQLIGYRIFQDMLGRTHYKRLSASNTTQLATALALTDLTIEVTNASVLTPPNPSLNIPGVIYIAGERIEFFTITGNTLGQIRRSTLGTGAIEYAVGTEVIDQGTGQTIPYQDQVQTTSTVITTSSQTAFVLNGITFNNTVNREDQVEVRYGGRVLLKPLKPGNTLLRHNSEIAYDTGDVNSWNTSSDTIILPEFAISTATTATLTLTFTPQPGVKLEVIRRTAQTWYNSQNTLAENTTPFARFLVDQPASLPDKYHYGQQ